MVVEKVPGWFFTVPGWFFMIPGCFFMFQWGFHVFFMVLNENILKGTRLICISVPRSRLLGLVGYRFHTSFHSPGQFFMISGGFSWLFMVPGWFSIIPDGFYGYSWFQVCFS